jgi:hypothetical protein
MATYRLGSSTAVYTPSIIAWAISGCDFPHDRDRLIGVISTTFPSVPKEAVAQLLTKVVTYTVEDETVVFSVEDRPEALPRLTCRKCAAHNPLVYFAPVTFDGAGTCICFDCAQARNWLDADGDLRPGVEL